MPRQIGFSHYEENFPGSDVTPEELEFFQAMERYRKKHRRRFPSLREILGVLKSLGYRKAIPTSSTEPSATDTPLTHT